jgi:stearoyl-CoA desaturase (delta-9 desaturase)
MLLPDWAVLNAAIDWLANGLWNLSWWQVVLYTLVTTHITIAAVTIFLHRTQAHRAMDLHPSRRTSSASGCGWAPAW